MSAQVLIELRSEAGVPVVGRQIAGYVEKVGEVGQAGSSNFFYTTDAQGRITIPVDVLFNVGDEVWVSVYNRFTSPLDTATWVAHFGRHRVQDVM